MGRIDNREDDIDSRHLSNSRSRIDPDNPMRPKRVSTNSPNLFALVSFRLVEYNHVCIMCASRGGQHVSWIMIHKWEIEMKSIFFLKKDRRILSIRGNLNCYFQKSISWSTWDWKERIFLSIINCMSIIFFFWKWYTKLKFQSM